MPNYEVYKKKEVIAISPVEICMAMDGKGTASVSHVWILKMR